MKPTYLGTKLEGDDYRAFGIKAAELGKSRSALLRALVLQFVTAETPKSAAVITPTKRKRKAA